MHAIFNRTKTSSLKKRALTLALVLTLLFSVAIPAFNVSAAEPTVINILHTNDMHGRLYQVDTNNAGMIGIDRIAAYYNSIDNAILVDAGDAIHGLPLVNINQGLNAIELMAAAGYSVMTAGNHEFNYGKDRLLALADIAKDEGLHIISANVIVEETEETFLPATRIEDIDGVKVGFFGISPTTTPIQTSPDNVVGLKFEDYVDYAEKAIESLKNDGADVIVALAHITRSGVDAVANALGDDIDLIVKGHDHFRGSFTVNGVLVVGAGEYMTHLGQVSITLDADNKITKKEATVIPRNIDGALNPVFSSSDSVVKALADKMRDDLLAELGVKVAISEVFLSDARGDATTPGVRNSEQPLGNLVADAMRIIGEADFALQNGGGLRAPIRVGEITKLDINAVLPFGNVLVILEVTPSSLKAALEQGLRDGLGVVGHFPQISGMEIVFDPAKPVGQKIVSITAGGEELDLNDDVTTFELATNNFMAVGGDGYTVLRDLDTIAEIGSLDDVLIEYITVNLGGVITADNAKIEGRLVAYCTVCDNIYEECVCWEPAELTNRFDDVPDAPSWKNAAVSWADLNGITTGSPADSDTFKPDNPVTRAEFITFLHRVFGKPEAEETAPFDDMPGNQDFRNAISWAYEEGITTGITPTLFRPNDSITREQIAAMLYRYIGEGELFSANILRGYADQNMISPWDGARDAVTWAVYYEIMGVGVNRLNPTGNATRAEAVTMLYRVVETFDIPAP